MENKFISPYKIIVIKGIIGIIVSIISIIISSLLKCEKMNGDEDFEDYQTFKFFVCSADYKGEKYYDHFIGYFTSFENAKERFKEAMLLILYSIVHFICELCFIFTNKFLSPTHYLIAESLYSLLHIPFDYLSLDDYNSVINELNGSDDPTVSDNSDDDNPDFYTVYQAIVHTFGTRILRFFSSIFDFFGYIIYLEIIELRFCGLNRNIKKISEKEQVLMQMMIMEIIQVLIQRKEMNRNQKKRKISISKNIYLKSCFYIKIYLLIKIDVLY
jgi:hypothetical protein